MKPNYRLSIKHTNLAEIEFCGGGGGGEKKKKKRKKREEKKIGKT